MADKEMLIALKMNAMRKTDVRDIFMLLTTDADLDKIVKHLEKMPKEKLEMHLTELERMTKSKNFKDTLQGAFSLLKPMVIEKGHRELNKLFGILGYKAKISD